MSNGHSVLQKIDRGRPYFTRKITRHLHGMATQHLLETWLPVEADQDGWLCAVTIDGLNLPDMSAMPGDAPLDALINAIKFIRILFDENEGTFLFDVWDYGKLPKNMECVLSDPGTSSPLPFGA
jgi:hypothetical protein